MITACVVGWHSYEVVRDCGINVYVRCRRCGKRKVRVRHCGAHQPVDQKWVDTGRWTSLRIHDDLFGELESLQEALSATRDEGE